MVARLSETGLYILFILFLIFIPAAFWVPALLFRNSFKNTINKLRVAFLEEDPTAIVMLLDTCIRKSYFGQFVARSEIPPVQDIEAFYGYYHNTFMRRIEKLPEKDRRSMMICIIAGLVSVAFIVLQGISWASLLAVPFFFLSLLGYIYANRMAFLFYRESLRLFQEIDARFTESLGSEATIGEMASPLGATFNERIQGLLQLDDCDAFLDEFKRAFPQMFAVMHNELPGQERRPAPHPETLEECSATFRREVLLPCENDTRAIKLGGYFTLFCCVVLGALLALHFTNGLIERDGWMLAFPLALCLFLARFFFYCPQGPAEDA